MQCSTHFQLDPDESAARLEHERIRKWKSRRKTTRMLDEMQVDPVYSRIHRMIKDPKLALDSGHKLTAAVTVITNR